MIESISIYLHIPFCKSKCNYCDFYSISSKSIDNQIIKNYLDATLKELEFYLPFLEDKYIQSIYFGGGTPNSIDNKILERFLSNFFGIIYDKIIDSNQKFLDKNIKEITIELNPHFISKEQIKLLHDFKFNRISLGVQALNDSALKFLGRNIDLIKTEQAIDLLLPSFSNISFDFIIGLPDLNLKDELTKIEKYILKFDSLKHLSFYILNVAYGTRLFNQIFNEQKNNPMIDKIEIKSVKDYLKVCKFMKELGFEHYEISNFAKNKAYSIHNQNYWVRNPYIGIGAMASSFLFDIRYHNSCINDYINTWRNFKSCFDKDFSKDELKKTLLSTMQDKKRKYEILNEEDKINEFIMLSLRTSKGLNFDKFKDEFNFDLYLKRKEKLNILNDKGLIKIKENVLYIEEKSWLFYNDIVSQLFL